MPRATRTAVAVAAALALAAMSAAPADAQVEMMSFGVPGPVSLLDFSGDIEAPPTSQTDVGQASVECDATPRGHRAVFAGALALAPDDTPGLHNDWRYVRVVAVAVDGEGRMRTGEVSPYYPAYDDSAATLPAVGVFLPRDGLIYTPVLMVQFYDSTYRLTGTAMVGAQAGAWLVSLPTPVLGDYWYVAADQLAQCG